MRLPPLNSLRSFEAAARAGSFTRAAAELLVTQAAVSQQVRALEEYLGYKLFDRSQRSVVLTPRGVVLAAAIRRGLGEIATAIAEAERGGAVTLRLTTSATVAGEILLPNLESFDLEPGHLLVDGTDLVRDLEAGAHDAALRCGRGGCSRLDVVEIARAAYLPVASPGYLRRGGFAAGDDVDVRRTAPDHRLIESGGPDLACHPSWNDYLGRRALDRARAVVVVGQQHLGLRAALAGQGVALVERHLAAGHLAAGGLVALGDEPLPGAHAYSFLTRAADAGDPRLAALLCWLRTLFERCAADARTWPPAPGGAHSAASIGRDDAGAAASSGNA